MTAVHVKGFVRRRMALSTCAGILLLLVAVDAACCPCFTSTRKGLLVLHWVLANFIASKSSAHWRDVPFGGWYGVLLPWATVLLLTESALAAPPRSPGMPSRNRLTTVSMLLFVDAMCVALNIVSELLVTVLLASLLLTGIAFRSTQKEKKKSDLRTEKELLSLYHDDLFCDPSNVYSGSGGFLNYCAITAGVLIKLFPVMGLVDIVLYALFLLRCIASIRLFMMPAIFGGSIQSVKVISRSLADRVSCQNLPSKIGR
ncbi:unnamed protein product [Toxocara canis]|uniref:Transmembrane protein n=1 Tax=Toxocara canis TaxID=6265 RepID=A0A183V1E6_TOXCA|nr:unnamed protein product [Toxocara canis]